MSADSKEINGPMPYFASGKRFVFLRIFLKTKLKFILFKV